MMAMFFILLACALTLAASQRRYDDQFYVRLFYDHILQYDIKIENGDQFYHRLSVFAENYDYIESENTRQTDYVLGVNKFSHLTKEEFKSYVTKGGLFPKRDKHAHSGDTKKDDPDWKIDLPLAIDWSTRGAVTPVKDQGNCGSCWSFSASGSIEGAYFLAYGNLISFSEQQMVSCDNGCSGCDGCDMDSAFAYANSIGGLPTEANYPYTSGNTGVSGNCQGGHTLIPGAAPKGYVDVQENSVQALMQAVAQQPVSIGIEADQAVFMNYLSGVITTGCGQSINHGVLLVGYGTTSAGVPYWKVKNSWSTGWGNAGYVLIARSNANQCGVLSSASYPVLK